jgi:tRNA 5-methylaminomethyl-2-thiouridine biosynthesis bifunctional protein
MENHKKQLSYFLDISIDKIVHQKSRVATRLSSTDYLPLVGEVASEKKYSNWYSNKLKKAWSAGSSPLTPGLFVNVAHGSHGLITIPILSEYLVRKSLAEPAIVNNWIANAVEPQRFFKRKVKKGR